MVSDVDAAREPHSDPVPSRSVRTISQLLDEAPRAGFHRRTVVISGMGFFTDAYDLFVIATVATLVKTQWHLSTTLVSVLTGSAILGAFLGATVLGRVADHLGRKSVYVLVAAIMVAGAIASAFAPNLAFLVVARFVLGIGIGGDYPVSAVLMSEYSNRPDRGRLVAMVFSMQALGLIVGPLVAIGLLGAGVPDGLTWRLLLGLGAIPAASVVALRSRMPESPRFRASIRGEHRLASSELEQYARGALAATGAVESRARRLGLREFLTDRRMLRLVVGTAGAWFLFDYAYYGNTLSLPGILTDISPNATTIVKLALSLALFVVFAVPGYALAVARMDRIGHRRLQLLGFTAMAVCFGVLAAVPALTASVAPFLVIFGVSYLFIEFGPNTTTFVLPAEIFPVSVRTTGHGLAAGVGKLGAFVGVFLVPALQDSIGLRGMLAVAAGAALLGVVVSRLLPEPAGRSLVEVADRHAEHPERALSVVGASS